MVYSTTPFRAENETRTRDPQLGKLMLYQTELLPHNAKIALFSILVYFFHMIKENDISL